MSIRWGVLYRGPAIAAALGLGQLGCHGHAPVGSVRVEEPGLYVTANPKSSSIVWPSGRVCTVSGEALAHGPPTPRPPGVPAAPSRAPEDAEMLDAFFFRLCEARANGDVSPEQYHLMVERFLTSVQRRGERSSGVPRRTQAWSRPQRDPRLWHGEDPGGLSATADAGVPEGAPMHPGLPPPIVQPPPAPTVPAELAPVAPLVPSTGTMPDTRR
jgi:hypothetical protein